MCIDLMLPGVVDAGRGGLGVEGGKKWGSVHHVIDSYQVDMCVCVCVCGGGGGGGSPPSV